MYIHDWDEFYDTASKLYNNNSKTRYSFKYRHKDSKLILKVTDDVVCIKYRTDQQDHLKHVEKLNSLFLHNMSADPKKK